MVVNAHWTVQDAPAPAAPVESEERDWITRCVAVAKAVQD